MERKQSKKLALVHLHVLLKCKINLFVMQIGALTKDNLSENWNLSIIIYLNLSRKKLSDCNKISPYMLIQMKQTSFLHTN